jgi:hypothetical protein
VAANAEVGVAKAQFFPQISLTGFGGGAFGRSSAFTGLMSSQLGIWSYGAQVSQPIFTGGALTRNLRAAESQHRQALIAYRQSIQRAFGDVSDALIADQKNHQVRVRQEDTVADLRESVRLSNMLHGGHNYLSRSSRWAAVTICSRADTCRNARCRNTKVWFNSIELSAEDGSKLHSINLSWDGHQIPSQTIPNLLCIHGVRRGGLATCLKVLTMALARMSRDFAALIVIA